MSQSSQYSPNSFDTFIGKEKIKNNLKIYIESSKLKKAPLEHCLIYGHPGTGKTTLSKIIANELHCRIKIVQGPDIQSKSDIISSISCLNDNDILFIDEIHAMNQQCFEILYSIMDNYQINIKIGKDGNSKITTINTPKITIISTTTLLGNISNAFEDRFGIILYMSSYTDEEIFKIIDIYASNLGVQLSKKVIKKIASNSKGIPRIAKRLVNRYLDFVKCNKSDIDNFFSQLEIYKYGLNKIDIEYLKILDINNSLGMKTISQSMNIDEKTILEKIEPYLLKKKLIIKNNKGRKLTQLGFDFINSIAS